MIESIPSWCKRGAKVICVNDGKFDAAAEWTPSEKIVKGETYTIARTWIDSEGYSVCDLEERHRDLRALRLWGAATGYWIARFRPLITKSKSEDVRMFKSLLRDMPASERLDRLAELLNE